jgi:nucleoside diphosphate kinase
MASGTIVIMHLRGSKAVARVRKMLGGTDPSTAETGSLRGTYGIDKTNNFMVTPPHTPRPHRTHTPRSCVGARREFIRKDTPQRGSVRANDVSTALLTDLRLLG